MCTSNLGRSTRPQSATKWLWPHRLYSQSTVPSASMTPRSFIDFMALWPAHASRSKRSLKSLRAVLQRLTATCLQSGLQMWLVHLAKCGEECPNLRQGRQGPSPAYLGVGKPREAQARVRSAAAASSALLSARASPNQPRAPFLSRSCHEHDAPACNSTPPSRETTSFANAGSSWPSPAA